MSLDAEMFKMLTQGNQQLLDEIRQIVREEIMRRPEPEEIRANQLHLYRPAYKWASVKRTWSDKLKVFTRKEGKINIINLKAFDETVKPKPLQPASKDDWVQAPGSKLRIPRSQLGRII